MTQTLIDRMYNQKFYEAHVEQFSPYASEYTEIEMAMILDGIDLPPGLTIITVGDAQQGEFAREKLAEIRKQAEDTAEKLHIWIGGQNNTKDMVHTMLNDLTERNAVAFDNMHRFRDVVVQQLVGMRIYVQSCLSASTHNEKNARIRGMDEMIEQGIERLEEIHFNESQIGLRHYWPYGVFASDSSRARLQRQVWELEEQVRRLKNGKEEAAEEELEEEFESSF